MARGGGAMYEGMGLPAESLKPCRRWQVKIVSRWLSPDVITWSSNLGVGWGFKNYSVRHYCFISPVGRDHGQETGLSAMGRQRIKSVTFRASTGCSNLLCTIRSATHIPRGGTVVKVLQIGRSLVRSQLVSFDFSLTWNPSDSTMALGSTQPLTEMSTRSISWGKGGRCVRLTTLLPSCAVVTKSGNLNFLEPSGPLRACNGTALPFTHIPHKKISNSSTCKRPIH